MSRGPLEKREVSGESGGWREADHAVELVALPTAR